MSQLEIKTTVDDVAITLRGHLVTTKYQPNGDLLIIVKVGTSIISNTLIKNSRIYEKQTRYRRRS